jgi:phosphoribosyl-ATP pyrophosphohydrolase
MIVPSIDIMQGQAVQLVGGREKALEAGDPLAIAEKFSLAGEIAVIDLDAALGRGDNRSVIEPLIRRYPCRVGGGIRTAERALEWLDRGAQAVILGTSAVPEILQQLPRQRVIAALDAFEGDVVVEGWQTRTGVSIEQKMRELQEFVGGFLITFVELEGRLQGTDLERAQHLLKLAKPARVTIAGGITTAEEVAALDRIGADAQVGMALYTGRLPLADAIAAPLVSDRPDGLWPTVVCDARGAALGLVYSNLESLRRSVEIQRGVYHSRSRGLWEKGATSGNGQELLRIDLDCDRDALRFTVRQLGQGFCHHNTWTCWGQEQGLTSLERRLHQRISSEEPGSYTRKLIAAPDLLAAKLQEEALELATASRPEDVIWEMADVLYFAMVALARAGLSLEEVERELDFRGLRLSRKSTSADSPKGK